MFLTSAIFKTMKFSLIWLVIGENRVVSTFLSMSSHLFLSTVLNPKRVLYKYLFFFYSLKTRKSIIKILRCPQGPRKNPIPTAWPWHFLFSFGSRPPTLIILNPLHHHKQNQLRKKNKTSHYPTVLKTEPWPKSN